MSDYLDLGLTSPYLNASGFLGFHPAHGLERYPFLGGWVTPPVSLRRRASAGNMTLMEFPGGVLIHTGLPNPGMNNVLKENGAAWRRLSIPTWFHLIPESASLVRAGVEKLEDLDLIAAVVLSLPETLSAKESLSCCLSAVGKIPLVIDVPLTCADLRPYEKMDLPNLIAISLSAPRGVLFGADQTRIGGRLYGPSIFPLAVASLEKALAQSLPVIIGGGVDSLEKGRRLLELGAAAVTVDLPLWTGVIPGLAD